MDPTIKRNMWRERIEQCLSSGLTISEWCRLNKIAPSTLYSWMAKFRKEEAALFPEQTTTEWIEITKEGLAAQVAMVPVPKTRQTPKTVKAEKTKQDISADISHTLNPAIHTRINGVEMAISAGCAQTDIENVFKAAMVL